MLLRRKEMQTARDLRRMIIEVQKKFLLKQIKVC